MDVIYLDQNHWISIARAKAGKGAEDIQDLYRRGLRAVATGRAIFPLSLSHILETSKRNDAESRWNLASAQAILSRGYVYRSRTARIEAEVKDLLCNRFGLEASVRAPRWALVPSFWQAFAPLDSLVATHGGNALPEAPQSSQSPAEAYLSFMTGQDDGERRHAHAMLFELADKAVSGIEERRIQLQGIPIELRVRVMSAMLFNEQQELFQRVLSDLNKSIADLAALGDCAITSLITNTPTLSIEAELSARREAETGKISPNDLFDMQAMYTSIPYSTHVIAEKASISRARQAGLGRKYRVNLSSSLDTLLDCESFAQFD
ncbi:hypothetical protein [Xanthomonas sp. LMG 12462]|uniref:hypothetical protein n=1 Tax=Xanthomonas sp. LMG 12462 TaxID=1591134 RepID=UPI001264253C|nr:hypothetical protein [Xanthomonas sp. LMG 12462]